MKSFMAFLLLKAEAILVIDGRK